MKTPSIFLLLGLFFAPSLFAQARAPGRISSSLTFSKSSVPLYRFYSTSTQDFKKPYIPLKSLVHRRKADPTFTLPNTFMKNWFNSTGKVIFRHSAKELSQNMWALARLGETVEPEFLKGWYASSELRLSEFTATDLSNSLWAHALIDSTHQGQLELDRPWMQAAFDHLDTLPDIKTIELHQLYVVLQHAALVQKAPFRISENLQNQIQLALKDLQSRPRSALSALQFEVSFHIKRLLPLIKEEYWSEVSATPVDLALPSHKLIIQIDGPHHFIKNSDGSERYSPSDLFLNGLWKAAGWKVVRIRHQEWSTLKTLHQQKSFIFEKLLPYMY